MDAIVEIVAALIGPVLGKWFWAARDRAAHRKPPLTRYVAWGLTLTWAVGATFYAILISLRGGGRLDEFVICIAPFLLPVWGAVLIPAFSEVAGGALLTAEGLMWFLVWVGSQPNLLSAEEWLVVSSGLLPLVAGILFVASWWKLQAAEREERKRVARQRVEAAKGYQQTGELAKEIDLSSADLPGVDLSKADLCRANLAEANLEGAFLLEAKLVEANLTRANLSLSNLERADLSNANLYGANLQGAVLAVATLDQADMRYANLRETNFRGAILWRANLSQADLRGADLQGADLMQAKFAGATLDDSTVMPGGWEAVVASKPQD
jgi:hypothetical protein